MEINGKQENKLLLIYQGFLAAIGVFYFFTKLDVFLEQTGIAPTPLTMVILYCAASFPLFLGFFSRIKYLQKSIIIWIWFYVSLSTFAFLLSMKSEKNIPFEPLFQDWRGRILGMIFLFVMLYIFSRFSEIQKLARWLILFMALVAIFNNFLELTNPLIFGALSGDGRPAGFYLDPNESGAALIFAMILTVTLLKPNWRLPYILLIGIGVALTFSRGGMLGWVLTIVVFTYNKIIDSKKIYGLLAVILFLWIILALQADNLKLLKNSDGSSLLNEDMQERIEWLQNPFDQKGDSYEADTSRLEFVGISLEKFMQHPVLGAGLSSSRIKNTSSENEEYGISPHNIHLVNLVEHGIIGITIVPTLMWATIKNASGETKAMGKAYAIFFLIAGLFSHTVLRDRYILLTVALMASMSMQSYLFPTIEKEKNND